MRGPRKTESKLTLTKHPFFRSQLNKKSLLEQWSSVQPKPKLKKIGTKPCTWKAHFFRSDKRTLNQRFSRSRPGKGLEKRLKKYIVRRRSVKENIEDHVYVKILASLFPKNENNLGRVEKLVKSEARDKRWLRSLKSVFNKLKMPKVGYFTSSATKGWDPRSAIAVLKAEGSEEWERHRLKIVSCKTREEQELANAAFEKFKMERRAAVVKKRSERWQKFLTKQKYLNDWQNECIERSVIAPNFETVLSFIISHLAELTQTDPLIEEENDQEAHAKWLKDEADKRMWRWVERADRLPEPIESGYKYHLYEETCLSFSAVMKKAIGSNTLPPSNVYPNVLSKFSERSLLISKNFADDFKSGLLKENIKYWRAARDRPKSRRQLILDMTEQKGPPFYLSASEYLSVNSDRKNAERNFWLAWYAREFWAEYGTQKLAKRWRKRRPLKKKYKRVNARIVSMSEKSKEKPKKKRRKRGRKTRRPVWEKIIFIPQKFHLDTIRRMHLEAKRWNKCVPVYVPLGVSNGWTRLVVSKPRLRISKNYPLRIALLKTRERQRYVRQLYRQIEKFRGRLKRFRSRLRQLVRSRRRTHAKEKLKRKQPKQTKNLKFTQRKRLEKLKSDRRHFLRKKLEAWLLKFTEQLEKSRRQGVKGLLLRYGAGRNLPRVYNYNLQGPVQRAKLLKFPRSYVWELEVHSNPAASRCLALVAPDRDSVSNSLRWTMLKEKLRALAPWFLEKGLRKVLNQAKDRRAKKLKKQKKRMKWRKKMQSMWRAEREENRVRYRIKTLKDRGKKLSEGEKKNWERMKAENKEKYFNPYAYNVLVKAVKRAQAKDPWKRVYEHDWYFKVVKGEQLAIRKADKQLKFKNKGERVKSAAGKKGRKKNVNSDRTKNAERKNKSNASRKKRRRE